MGGTLSRIFHRRQDDESKPKVKKPRRFGSLRRQRTEEQETGTRVSRSSTMPSRTHHVRTEERSAGLLEETAEEAQRLEDRQDIIRDVMDSDETVTAVADQHLSAQMPHVKPSHVSEHKEVVPEIKAELPGGFAAVQLVSVTSNDKIVEGVPELRPMTEALHEEEDEPVILKVEDLQQLPQEHEEHIEDTEQKIPREQNIESIMEPKKSAEEITEPVEEVSADSTGLTHTEQDFEHNQEEVFTQEDSKHVKETSDYLHAEGSGFEGKPQSAELLHSEPAYNQADETENLQGYVPTVVCETAENSFAEKEENHVLPEDAHHNEELLGSSKQEDVDYMLITQETPIRQDLEHTGKYVSDQAESSEDNDKALREDQSEPSDITEEVQYLQEVKTFEEHEQEDKILRGDLIDDEEVVGKFAVEHMEHVNISQEFSDVQNSERPFERQDYDNLPHADVEHTEDGIKELPTEDAKLENMSQIVDDQYLQQPLEYEAQDRLLQEFTEHTEEPLEQLSAKDAEPKDISQEVSDSNYSQQPPEQEPKDHLLHDYSEHTEGSTENLRARDADLKDIPQEALDVEHSQQPLEHETGDRLLQEFTEHTEEPVEQLFAKDAELADMPQEVLDAEHFQQPLEQEVRDRGLCDYDEHTEGSAEHFPAKDAELEDMPQEVLDAERFRQSPEHETDNLLQEYTGQTAGFAGFSDVPQVALDTQHSGQTEWQEGIDIVQQEVGDDEGTSDNSKCTDAFQETPENQHLEQPPEYDDGDRTQHQDTEHVEKPPEGSSIQDIEQADTTLEIVDIQYTEFPGQHLPGGDVSHGDIIEDNYIPQETLDIQHSEQVLEQESKDTSKVEGNNGDIPDEPTDYGNEFIKIVDGQQPELEGEQQVVHSEGHSENDPIMDSVSQYSQGEPELEPEHGGQASEHAVKPYFESADNTEETDHVEREHVIEQNDAQVGECQSEHTEHTKLDPALSGISETCYNAHEDIKLTEETTNGLEPDQVELAESHGSGSAEPMPDNGIINGLDVEHVPLKQNVSEVVESNGDFDYSIKPPNARLADQQDFDSDISQSPKLTVAGDPSHDEDQHSNGLPVTGAENVI